VTTEENPGKYILKVVTVGINVNKYNGSQYVL
jgi:hypothetical protein